MLYKHKHKSKENEISRFSSAHAYVAFIPSADNKSRNILYFFVTFLLIHKLFSLKLNFLCFSHDEVVNLTALKSVM